MPFPLFYIARSRNIYIKITQILIVETTVVATGSYILYDLGYAFGIG